MRFYCICRLLALIFFVMPCLGASAQNTIHHGPVLDVKVQRGGEILSLFQVPRLLKGDLVLVKPELSSLAKGEWALLLARVSPAGNQVDSFGFDLQAIQEPASLEITADEQIPVILLAPQLRNLFGLYTSFTESADLLQQALRSDPQRFYDLQRLDQINQAISALSQGLDQVVMNRSPDQAVESAKALAIQFGVRSLDPECFKNRSVNTLCVAANIVANKDFVLPTSNDLGMVMGQKKAADLTSFLTANVRIFSEAGDFLSHKFRDQYDFAPTFGRRKGDTGNIQLYSMTRFKSGDVKTAYVYVPAWFSAPTPVLTVHDMPKACLHAGRLDVKVSGRLPVVNYWHSWEMSLFDPVTDELLAESDNISFSPERGLFQYGDVAPLSKRLTDVKARIKGKFGFENIELPAFKAALPLQGDLSKYLVGAASLISGEAGELNLATADQAACIERLLLERQGVTVARSNPESAHFLKADLSRVAPGKARLWVFLKGSEPQSVDLSILNARAVVTSIEHADLDLSLQVQGEQLERIARLQVGDILCLPQGVQEETQTQSRMSMTCPEGIKHNVQLPDWVTVHHEGNEPPAFQVRLKKTQAKPRFQLASMANALLVQPSPKALQWGLSPQELFISEDSGLSLLLGTQGGYKLARGSYTLQMRFVDDPITAQKPLSAPMMADFVHQELRTRMPMSFKGAELPSVINPLEFRIRHEPSGLEGAWSPLGRAVLMLPDVRQVSCAPEAGKLWVHGSQLDLIDRTAWETASPPDAEPAILTPCPEGLCIQLSAASESTKLAISLRWVSHRAFSVELGKRPSCPP